MGQKSRNVVPVSVLRTPPARSSNCSWKRNCGRYALSSSGGALRRHRAPQHSERQTVLRKQRSGARCLKRNCLSVGSRAPPPTSGSSSTKVVEEVWDAPLRTFTGFLIRTGGGREKFYEERSGIRGETPPPTRNNREQKQPLQPETSC